MAGKAQDIRITKTQRALVYAMLHLLEKNSFQKITVNDICQEALVSRSTFYVHFEDKYKLLHFCTQELMREMKERTHEKEGRQILEAALQQVHDHANIYKNVFADDPSRELITMFREHFALVFQGILEKHKESLPVLSGPPELISAFYAGGFASMVMWWASNGFQIPVEEVAASLLSLLQGLLPDENLGL